MALLLSGSREDITPILLSTLELASSLVSLTTQAQKGGPRAYPPFTLYLFYLKDLTKSDVIKFKRAGSSEFSKGELTGRAGIVVDINEN